MTSPATARTPRVLVDLAASASPAQVVETHISVLFLLGDRAFKLRKPVRFGFLDFSRREARESDCYREVELNRRYAPDVYLGVYDISDGGEPIDHLVVMRRLPADRRLSELVRHGSAGRREIDAVARVVLQADERAERTVRINAEARPDALLAGWRTNGEELAPFLGTVIDASANEEIQRLAANYLQGRSALLEDRIRQGRVRDGHGDIRAEDIYCLEDGPRILDCVEFDDTLRYGDVLCDLAFLVMDLEHLGAPDLGRELLRSYATSSGDTFPFSLVDAYCASRAYVRAKVACLGTAEGVPGSEEEARSYHSLAHRLLVRARVKLVLVGGLPGTGKSSLAASLGASFDMAVLRADVVRKELAQSCAVGTAELYADEMTDATYEAMLAAARPLLEHGQSVVLDASWHDEAMRSRASSLAAETASELVEFQCCAPRAITEARIQLRRQRGDDPSDATIDVARAMAEITDEWPRAIQIDTSDTPAHSLELAAAALRPRHGG